MIAVISLPFAAWAFACSVLAVVAVAKKGFKWWAILCLNAGMIIFTVSFVSVTSKCLEVLDCTYVSEEKLHLVMKSLPSVECDSQEWMTDYFLVVLPVLVFYLGMPC